MDLTNILLFLLGASLFILAFFVVGMCVGYGILSLYKMASESEFEERFLSNIRNIETFNEVVHSFLSEIQKGIREVEDEVYLDMLYRYRESMNQTELYRDQGYYYMQNHSSLWLFVYAAFNRRFREQTQAYKNQMIELMQLKEDQALGIEHIADDRSFINNIQNVYKNRFIKAPSFLLTDRKRF